MDNPVQGKVLVVISVLVVGAAMFFEVGGTAAYVLYGLSGLLFVLGILNWSVR